MTKPEKQLPSTTMKKIARLDAPTILTLIDRYARDPDVDPAKYRALLEIQESVARKAAESEFTRDFNRLVPALPKVNKDGMIVIAPKPGKSGQQTRYASLDNIMEALWPILAAHHFGFQWQSEVIPDHGALTHVCRARLTHDNGVFRESSWPIYPETTGSKNDAQARGSGSSYAKRYTLRDLVPFVSFAKEDRDDGGAAVAGKEQSQEPEREPRVSREQAKALRKAVKDNHVPPAVFQEKFCDNGEIEDVPASRFNSALAACEAYGKRWNEAQQKKEGKGEAA